MAANPAPDALLPWALEALGHDDACAPLPQLAPVAGDARFLLAFERYFTGDPRCREDLEAIAVALPGDPAVELLTQGAKDRFRASEELPPIR